MNKQLGELLARVLHWPEWAQAETLRVLENIEERVAWESNLSVEDRAKLSSLRQTIRDSIARGGSFTDEEVEASVTAALDAWEQKRKSA
jgi:hypothetical protein